jgi:ABC-2 type transport system ATP-binding protein
VRAGMTLEERFVDLVGGATDVGRGLAWLRSSSD